MKKPKCPYCGSDTTLCDSSRVYFGKSYGMIYLCNNYPKCDAYVGVHRGTTRPLGRLANKELRELKMKVHSLFDKLWMNRGMKRSEAYALLAGLMGLKKRKCHIALFDNDMCKKAYEVLKKSKK